LLTTSPLPIPLAAGAHVKLQHDVHIVGQQRDLDSAPIPAEAARHSGMMPPTDSEMISPIVPR
jgi:hypothetical protein